MFRPPEAPSTYQTLQVNCVACQVMFTIAEGTPGAGPDDARPAAAGPADARAGHRDWRLPAAERPYIRYQFRPNTAERETGPVGRPETLGEEAPGGEETAVDAPLVAPRPYVSLNCPRCGALNERSAVREI